MQIIMKITAEKPMNRIKRNRLTGREDQGIQAGGKMNDKKKKEKKRGGLPTQMNLVIHMAAGAYLMYLAYSIYGDAGTATGGEKIALGLAILVFVVVGAICVFSSLRSLVKGEYEGGAGDPNRGNKGEEPGQKEDEISEERRIRFDEREEESEENAEEN